MKRRPFTLVVFTSLSGALGAASLATTSSSCTSSNSTPPADAGTGDTSVPDATIPDGNVSDATPPPDGAVADASKGDGEAGAVSQVVTPTLLFANSAEAGAANVDPNLVNPWGLAFNAAGVAWVNDERTGVATVYRSGATAAALTVTIPAPAAADAGAISRPTGIVFNHASADFKGDTFIFATLDGTISGWQASFDVATSAQIRVDNSAGLPTQNQVYTGLALLATSPGVLLAANFRKGTIDVFDAIYAQLTPSAGAWTDPSVPAGYAPFNVVALGSTVYVAYAQQDPTKTLGMPGGGAGAVSAFDLTGKLLRSVVSQVDGGALNAPWGVAWAPASWGALGGDLLVGNFGNGWINAYNPATGAFLGHLVGASGQPIAFSGLWSLEFPIAYAADGGTVTEIDAGDASLPLYFTAGPALGTEGLFGTLSVSP